MKRLVISASLLLGMSLLLAATTFAANKGSMQIPDPVYVNGKTVPAGDYRVEWEGSGPHVELSIRDGNKVVATAEARVVVLEQSDPWNSAVTRKNDDGSQSLVEIHFSGKKYALVLGGR